MKDMLLKLTKSNFGRTCFPYPNENFTNANTSEGWPADFKTSMALRSSTTRKSSRKNIKALGDHHSIVRINIPFAVNTMNNYFSRGQNSECTCIHVPIKYLSCGRDY